MNKKIKGVSTAAIIAALYVLLTYLSSILGLSSGAIQCRFSEALCVLPVFTPAAIPGLFIGCALSNLLTGGAVFDIVFGSVATLIGAIGTYYVFKATKNTLLSLVCPVVSNTVIIPFVLKFGYGLSEGLWYFFITVGIGEIISCIVLGVILYKALKNKAKYIFKI